MAMRRVLKGVGLGTLIIAFAAIGVAAGALYLWSHRSGQVAGRIAEAINTKLLDEESRFTVARVSGNPLREIQLHDVQIHRHAGGGQWRRVLRAPEVRARYGLGATLREGRFVGTIEIVRPEVRIERLPGGGISFPSFRGGGRDEGGGGVIEVRGIAIHDGTLSVDAGGPKREIGGIQLLGDVVVEKGATEILLRSGSCVVAAPAETVVALAGVMRLAGGRLEISSLGIETPNSDLSLHGVIAGPADTAGTRLEAAVKRLDLAEVERIRSLSPLHPGGHLGGRISLGSRGRAADFDWNLTGRVGPDSLIVCSGHGDMAGSVLRISDLLVRSGPLEARGSAEVAWEGAATVHAGLDVLGFDLSRPPLWPFAEGLPPSVLSGHVAIEARGVGTNEATAAVRAELGPGRVDRLSFESGFVDLDVRAGGEIEVRGAGLNAGGGRLTAAGRLRPEGDVELDVVAERFGLEAMGGYWKDVVVEGRADLAGRITGPAAAPRFEAAGRLAPFLVAGIAADSVAVLSARGDLIPVIRFEAAVAAPALRVAGQEVRDADLTVRLSPGEVVFEDAKGRLAGLDVSADARMLQAGRDQDLRVTRLDVTAGGRPWRGDGEIRLRLLRDGFQLEPSALESEGGRIAVAGHSLREGADLVFTVETRGFDLGLLQGFLPRAGLDGAADVSAEIRGGRDALEGRLDLEVRDLRAAGDSLDALRVGIDAVGQRWRLRELSARAGEARIGASGEIVWGASLPDVVAAIRGRDRSRIAEAVLDVRLDGRALPIARLAGAADTLLPSGSLDIEGSLRGTIEAPEIDVRVTAANGRILSAPYDRVSGNVLYRQNVLTVSAGEAVRGPTRAEVNGFIPLRLGLPWAPPELPEEPMRFTVSVAEGDLAVAPEYVPVIGSASGAFRGVLVVSGTPRHPKASGRVTVRDATVRPLGRSEVLAAGEADISVSEEGGIRLERLFARQGRKGEIRATGAFRSLRDFEFIVDVKDGVLHEIEVFDARFDGRFTAHPDSITIPGQVRPRLSGNVTVKEAVIVQEFEVAPRPVEQIPWLFDIEAEITSRLFVRNRFADIELGADGPIVVRNDGGLWFFNGTLNALRGEYAAPQINARFRIESGTIDLLGIPGENPRVDVVASTRVPRYAEAGSGKLSYVTVTVHLTGDVLSPTVTLESDDPDLSQSDIMQLMTVGQVATQAQTGLSPAEVGYPVFVTSFFERQFRDLLPGIGTGGVAIETRTGDAAAGFAVRVAQYLAPGVLLEYSQGLSVDPDQEIAVEYHISRNLYLRGGVLREKILKDTLGDEYNLDFKFKFEY
jgi:autotransporter translocation and assembly factor TamB